MRGHHSSFGESMSLCRELKKKHGEKIRELAEIGTMIEAGMYVCRRKDGTETTTPIVMGSREAIELPEAQFNECGKARDVGWIHTHVAEERYAIPPENQEAAKKIEEFESSPSLSDLYGVLRDGHEFVCALRKGKMRCNDFKNLTANLLIDINSSYQMEIMSMSKDPKYRDRFWKQMRNIRKNLPKCKVDIKK